MMIAWHIIAYLSDLEGQGILSVPVVGAEHIQQELDAILALELLRRLHNVARQDIHELVLHFDLGTCPQREVQQQMTIHMFKQAFLLCGRSRQDSRK